MPASAPVNPVQIKEIIVYGAAAVRLDESTTKGVDPYAPRREIICDQRKVSEADRLGELVDFARNIGNVAVALQSNHDEITRVITDEFSFYPRERPVTIDDYKKIITQIAQVVCSMPANIHLVLASFPVVWLDGHLHNCCLYVESPKQAGGKPTLHHFEKKNPALVDYSYQRSDGHVYALSGLSGPGALSSEVVLAGTEVSVGCINQYMGALKLSAADGREFFCTVGICSDHSHMVERQQLHSLIQQLAFFRQTIPIQCSHVIVSASIYERSAHVLADVAHADPNNLVRWHGEDLVHSEEKLAQFPGRKCKNETYVPVVTDATEMAAEVEEHDYKALGVLHSDLLLHVAAESAPESFQKHRDALDCNGNSLLHLVLSRQASCALDRELQAKMVFSLVLLGANPELTNHAGKTPQQLAAAVDAEYATRGITSAMLTNAMQRAVVAQQERLAHDRILENGETVFIDILFKQWHLPTLLDTAAQLIARGADPYRKNARNLSLLDLSRQYHLELYHKMQDSLLDLQWQAVPRASLAVNLPAYASHAARSGRGLPSGSSSDTNVVDEDVKEHDAVGVTKTGIVMPEW